MIIDDSLVRSYIYESHSVVTDVALSLFRRLNISDHVLVYKPNSEVQFTRQVRLIFFRQITQMCNEFTCLETIANADK